MPGETPSTRESPRPRCWGGPCLILTWLLYFRVFVQCQTWLLCLLLIFVFSNDVCFMPPAPLLVLCRGSPRGPPRGSVPPWGQDPARPRTPVPARGQRTQETREKLPQKWWFSEKQKYLIISCASRSLKISLALDTESCEVNHHPPLLP